MTARSPDIFGYYDSEDEEEQLDTESDHSNSTVNRCDPLNRLHKVVKNYLVERYEVEMKLNVSPVRVNLRRTRRLQLTIKYCRCTEDV